MPGSLPTRSRTGYRSTEQPHAATGWRRGTDRRLDLKHGSLMNPDSAPQMSLMRHRSELFGLTSAPHHRPLDYGCKCDSTSHSWQSTPRDTSVKTSEVSWSPNVAASSIALRAESPKAASAAVTAARCDFSSATPSLYCSRKDRWTATWIVPSAVAPRAPAHSAIVSE